MKRITITLICLIIIFLSLSCDKIYKSQIEAYNISRNEQPLTDRDIAACFYALGLHYERFTCMLPERTGITFSSTTYIKGQKQEGNASGTAYVDKGKQNFILFLKKDNDRIEFTLASSGGSVGCGSASVEGYHATTWGWLPVEKLTQDKQPVFLYAANKEGITGFSTPVDDIEAKVAEYDFAVVVYIAIANKE